MKIVLFGASGMIGSRVLLEAVRRGHGVTAVARDPSRINAASPQVQARVGDILDPHSVAEAAAGHDVVIDAFGPGPEGDVERVVQAAHALIAGLQAAGVPRLIVVGGAGSLRVGVGMQLVDTPQFPAGWKAIALAHRDSLAVLQSEGSNLNWTYFSPPALIEPGERVGKFRLGSEDLLVDEAGVSRISAEDFAIAIVDEAETERDAPIRLTAAY